jgi:hypothetical protein
LTILWSKGTDEVSLSLSLSLLVSIEKHSLNFTGYIELNKRVIMNANSEESGKKGL